MSTSTYLQQLQQGLHELMARDPRVLFLGEDVLDPYGGAFKVSAGLSTAFPGRVLTTPIAEAGITGVGAGLALRGYRPLVEIMFGDFLTLCADQLVNHASKFTQMYPGVDCPLVLRTPVGGGRGYGPTHSQSLEKMFLGIPGLKLLAPSHAHRPGDTLQQVVAQERGPVLFLEHKLLYGEKLLESTPDLPLHHVADGDGYHTAVLRNFAQGTADVALVAYGGVARLLPKLLRTLANEEIRVCAVLPECIDPVPWHSLTQALAGCERVLVLDEGHEGFSWASGVAAGLHERLWGQLAAPVRVLASERRIIPTSFEQEAQMLLGTQKIENAILELLSWA